MTFGIETYTINDEPVIRRALMRRLDAEPGVRVLEIKAHEHKRNIDAGGIIRRAPIEPFITVGVLLHVDDKVILNATFDMPPQFKLAHVVNEADEIAEQCKEARKTFALGQSLPDIGTRSEVHQARGTGRRGNWRKIYGERAG
jgi:hypothetical protein